MFTKVEGKPIQLQFSRLKHDQNKEKIIERVVVELIRDNENDQFGVTLGNDGDFVVVTAVEGLAAAAGIKVNDAVFYINGERIFGQTDYAKLIEGQKKVLYKIKRGGKHLGKIEFEEKSMTIRIPFSAGDVLGLKLSKDLIVTKIQPGSVGEEKFEVYFVVKFNVSKF